TREHRHAERHDTDVFFLDAFRGFDRRLTLLAPPGLHHVEGVETDQHAACDLEGADRDSEDPEDHAAAQREGGERDCACPRTTPGEDATLLRSVARGHGEKCRNDGERVNDEEDRGEDQYQLDRAFSHRMRGWLLRSVRGRLGRRDLYRIFSRRTSPDRRDAGGRPYSHRLPCTKRPRCLR